MNECITVGNTCPKDGREHQRFLSKYSHIQYASFDGINLYWDFIGFTEQYNTHTSEFTIKPNYLIKTALDYKGTSVLQSIVMYSHFR